jgi:TDG/mug DNA glycosylase family protein
MSPSSRPWRPTRKQIAAASGKTLPDVLAPDLRVVFCGINPGLYSAAVAHHFARPGNRFWPALHAAGFTDRLFSPFEDHDLPRIGYGLTNIASRATARAEELTGEELRAGAALLTDKMRIYRPRFLAFLGVGAYRTAFARPKATLGRQTDGLADTTVWVLPSPSGLNAYYDLNALAHLYRELRVASRPPEEWDQ